LDGSENNLLDIKDSCEKSRFVTAGAQNDVPLLLHMLVVELSTLTLLIIIYTNTAVTYVCTRLFITVNIAVTLQITNNKEMKNTH